MSKVKLNTQTELKLKTQPRQSQLKHPLPTYDS